MGGFTAFFHLFDGFAAFRHSGCLDGSSENILYNRTDCGRAIRGSNEDMSLTSREKPLDYSIMKYRAKKNKMLRTSTTTESGEEIAGGSEGVSPRRS